jgi:hydrogenase expression/formation protein HypC
MCLAIPGEIISIDESDAFLRNGRVSFGGVIKEISLAVLPEAKVGDYALVHAGMAISIVDEEEAAKIFDYLQAIDEVNSMPELES